MSLVSDGMYWDTLWSKSGLMAGLKAGNRILISTIWGQYRHSLEIYPGSRSIGACKVNVIGIAGYKIQLLKRSKG